MAARRQVVLLGLVLVLVMGLPASGASGQDGEGVAGPLAPSEYTHAEDVKIEGALEIEASLLWIDFDDTDAGHTDWQIRVASMVPAPAT